MPKKLLFFYYTKINIKGEGISEKDLTVDIKIYFPIHQIFFSLASQAPAGKKGKPGRAAEMETDRGSCAGP